VRGFSLTSLQLPSSSSSSFNSCSIPEIPKPTGIAFSVNRIQKSKIEGLRLKVSEAGPSPASHRAILVIFMENSCVQKLGLFSQFSTLSAPLTSLCQGWSGVCHGFVQGSKLTKPLILLICHSVMGPEGGGGGGGGNRMAICTIFWQRPPPTGLLAVHNPFLFGKSASHQRPNFLRSTFLNIHFAPDL
jgi:hypothetical protein